MMDQSYLIISIDKLIFAQIDKRNVVHVELLMYRAEGASFNVQLVKLDVKIFLNFLSSLLLMKYLNFPHKLLELLLLLEADCGFCRTQSFLLAREINQWIARFQLIT